MFEDWGEFTRLALFGLLMTCLEWWAFEATVILAGETLDAFSFINMITTIAQRRIEHKHSVFKDRISIIRQYINVSSSTFTTLSY